MRPVLSLLIIFATAITSLSAQQVKLAQEYYKNGEYEKAAEMYEEIFEQNKRNDYYFARWVQCLTKLKEYKKAETVVKKELKRNNKATHHHVTLGSIYDQQFEVQKAEGEYQKAIDALKADQGQIQKVAVAFTNLAKYDWGRKAYEKGAKLLKDDLVFAYNLGDLYRRAGKNAQMIEQFLLSVQHNPKRLTNVQNLLDRSLDDAGFDTLKMVIYDQLQTTESTELMELLAWASIQQKDYRSALRQYQALDTRLNENGTRVMELAGTAGNDRDYDTAIRACQYIIGKGRDGTTYFLDAQQALLYNKRQKLVRNFDYSQDELRELESEYVRFLDDYGWNASSANIILELADLEAFYLHDRSKAIDYLNRITGLESVNKYVRAKAKLQLGDIYLMEQEVWESTLLYSQVDKEFREELMGQEARFKNAKLSYYNGNFEWAQSQFDVLKSSTSRMISNDAIDLSVFITDNLGLDSTAVPMEMYAEADLLIFQNRFDDAIAKLDAIGKMFPDHKLVDDILYSKAQVHFEKKEVEQCVALYEQIVADYPDEIRADNALFNLGYIYEEILDQPDKAKEKYERLFLEYTDSTFAIEARKKYRQLRGDNL